MRVASPAEMEAVGARLAGASLARGGVIHLRGALGAGKTTLVRGLLRSLGHRGSVKSPTYTLMESYHLGRIEVHHLDLYRLNDPEELEFIGLRDVLEGGTLCLVEWPERGGVFAPRADVEITLGIVDEASRELTASALTPIGEDILRGAGIPVGAAS